VSASSHAGPIDAEPAGTVDANVHAGVRLLASAVVFLFMAFVFAFLYLRALNSSHDFHPSNVNPPQGWGIAILVCVLAAAAVFDRARRGLASGAEAAWRSTSLVALGLAALVFVLQIIEYFELSFQTNGGGYASVFWGWTTVFLLTWLGAIYWIETLVAQTLRGNAEKGSGTLRGSADGCTVFLYTCALVAVVGWILLYLVK
jgi:heme/copper-type cytochrome/quinol oxidase subunit 3